MGKYKYAAKGMLARGLALTMVFGMMTPSASVLAANDVKGHWAEQTIAEWRDKGFIGGYEDGTFKPDNAITRAEFVRLINQTMGFSGGDSADFTDVNSGDWFFKDVSSAMEKGYCSGFPDGTFRPNASVTRAQAAVFVANAAGLSANQAAAEKFTDASAFPDWSKGAVGAVAEAGLMSGYPDGSFRSGKFFTRAEAVSTLDRLLRENEEKEDKPKEAVSQENHTIENAGEKLENQTINGDLIISSKAANGTVEIENVTVKGNIIVQGGSKVTLTDCAADGRLVMDKKGVTVTLKADTEAYDVVFKQGGSVLGVNFKNYLSDVTVSEDLATDSSSAVIIGIPADSVTLDGKSYLKLKEDVDFVTVSSAASGSKVEIASGKTIKKLAAYGKVTILGSGSITMLEANVSGVTRGGSVKIDTTSGNYRISSIDSGGSGSGGSSGGGSGEVKVTAENLAKKIINVADIRMDKFNAAAADIKAELKKVGTAIAANADYEVTFTPNAAINDPTVSTSEQILTIVGTYTVTNRNDAKDTAKSAEVTVNVIIPAKIAVSGVTFEPNSITLTLGDRQTLTAAITPSNASVQNITWASGSESIVTVDENGTVASVSTGTTIITATADGISGTCMVTVANIDNVISDNTKLTFGTGGSVTYTVDTLSIDENIKATAKWTDSRGKDTSGPDGAILPTETSGVSINEDTIAVASADVTPAGTYYFVLTYTLNGTKVKSRPIKFEVGKKKIDASVQPSSADSFTLGKDGNPSPADEKITLSVPGVKDGMSISDITVSPALTGLVLTATGSSANGTVELTLSGEDAAIQSETLYTLTVLPSAMGTADNYGASDAVTIKIVPDANIKKLNVDKEKMIGYKFIIPLANQNEQNTKTTWVQAAVTGILENGTTAAVTYDSGSGKYKATLTLGNVTDSAELNVKEERKAPVGVTSEGGTELYTSVIKGLEADIQYEYILTDTDSEPTADDWENSTGVRKSDGSDVTITVTKGHSAYMFLRYAETETKGASRAAKVSLNVKTSDLKLSAARVAGEDIRGTGDGGTYESPAELSLILENGSLTSGKTLVVGADDGIDITYAIAATDEKPAETAISMATVKGTDMTVDLTNAKAIYLKVTDNVMGTAVYYKITLTEKIVASNPILKVNTATVAGIKVMEPSEPAGFGTFESPVELEVELPSDTDLTNVMLNLEGDTTDAAVSILTKTDDSALSLSDTFRDTLTGVNLTDVKFIYVKVASGENATYSKIAVTVSA